MMGTAILNQPFGMIACVGRSLVRGSPVSAPARSSRHRVKQATTSSLLFDVRKAFTAILVFAIILGSLVAGPAAHERLQSDIPASAQSLDDIAKAPGEPGTPAKGLTAGMCTGLCTAYAFGLPPVFAQSVMLFIKRAVWLVVDDQWSQSSHPSRLERPPRV